MDAGSPSAKGRSVGGKRGRAACLLPQALAVHRVREIDAPGHGPSRSGARCPGGAELLAAEHLAQGAEKLGAGAGGDWRADRERLEGQKNSWAAPEAMARVLAPPRPMDGKKQRRQGVWSGEHMRGFLADTRATVR